MDSFGNNELARLLRLKRYERPPSDYFENFLHEFRRRRQRDELLREPVWSICVVRVRDFLFRHNVRLLVGYSARIAAAVACIAVISITLYRQPDTTQLAVQSSPVPSTPADTEKQLDFPPPVFPPTFDMQLALLLQSRDVPELLPAYSLRSDQFVPLELEWKSPGDQSPLEK